MLVSVAVLFSIFNIYVIWIPLPSLSLGYNGWGFVNLIYLFKEPTLSFIIFVLLFIRVLFLFHQFLPCSEFLSIYWVEVWCACLFKGLYGLSLGHWFDTSLIRWIYRPFSQRQLSLYSMGFGMLSFHFHFDKDVLIPSWFLKGLTPHSVLCSLISMSLSMV